MSDDGRENHQMNDNTPIRILIVDGKLISGGVEAFLMNIYRHIDTSRVQFDFLVHYKERFFYDDEVESLGGRIYRLSFRNDNNLFRYKKDLKEFFSTHREYNIVWGHMDGLAGIYLKIAKECGVPVTIAHSHITSSEKSLKGLIKRLLRRDIPKYADYRFACSTEAGKYLYGKSDFRLIHNAIDTDKFRFNEEARNRIRKAHNWENCTVVGHVGRFFPQKNHRYLVEIFRELSALDDSFRLCLCGDGEDRQAVEAMVKEYKLDPKVVFTGSITNMNEYYQAFDIFILPSLYEGLPVSGIEAQTSGLPCLFSDTITREVSLVPDNVQFMSINDDPRVWAHRLLTLRGKSRRDTSEEIKKGGYDISDLAGQLQEMFEKMHNDCA